MHVSRLSEHLKRYLEFGRYDNDTYGSESKSMTCVSLTHTYLPASPLLLNWALNIITGIRIRHCREYCVEIINKAVNAEYRVYADYNPDRKGCRAKINFRQEPTLSTELHNLTDLTYLVLIDSSGHI